MRFTREQLREMRYAGLLHDFGKVGVREQVLVKAEEALSRPTSSSSATGSRSSCRRPISSFERERVELSARRRPRRARRGASSELCAARDATRDELDRYLDAIVKANEPTSARGQLRRAASRSTRVTYVDFDGVERPLLADEELQFLMIRKGNLDERERREIESHVTHTYRFLSRSRGRASCAAFPDIAFGHHEKLNGRGYPRAVTARRSRCRRA